MALFTRCVDFASGSKSKCYDFKIKFWHCFRVEAFHKHIVVERRENIFVSFLLKHTVSGLYQYRN